MPVEVAAGSNPKSGDEGGHHDRAKPEDRAFDSGILNRMAANTELIDVFEHDDAGLHRNTEQGEKSDARRHAEVGAGKIQSQYSADRRYADIAENEQGPFERTEHCVENHEDHEERDRQNDGQTLLGALGAFIFARPNGTVSGRQFDLLGRRV